MEKAGFVDQKAAARFERVRAQVLAQPLRFAAQGSVVAGWRTYRGRRLGPYFRLAYRDGGRQRSIYLARCAELARRVRELLAGLQRPRISGGRPVVAAFFTGRLAESRRRAVWAEA